MIETKAGKNVLVFITLLIVILVCVYGYQEYQQNKGRDEIADKIVNSRLFSISPSLALLVHSGNSNEKIDCLLANVSSNKDNQNSNEKTNDIIEKIFEGRSETCKTWKVVNEYNHKVANMALKEGKIGSNGFLFYAYSLLEGQSSREYTSYTVGLFSNIEDCQNAEKVFIKYDYATKLCREWNPRGLQHD